MLQQETFSDFSQGRRIRLYTIHNPQGMTAHITNYGAKVVALLAPDRNGQLADVVLGFSTLHEWQTREPYFNAVIGRVANRIKDGRFSLDGKDYQLDCNNGSNHLHGGRSGFNDKVWEVVGQTAYSLSMHYRSRDGEEGYPGTLDVYVTYRVTRDNALEITYEAKSDKPTIAGFTNHAYFNLSGEGNGDIRDHQLQVLADYYTPFDETSCPTGEVATVDGTPMDFRMPTRIGDRIDLDFFSRGRGIDNNFVLRKAEDGKESRLAAVLSAGERTMEVWTTMPALQVYTGNYIGENTGKSGKPYYPQCAICLEAQNIPDAINHSAFPSPVLREGEVYYEKCAYRFV